MTYVKAFLQSKDHDGRHTKEAEGLVEIKKQLDEHFFLVKTEDGVLCKALLNPFIGKFFADDVYSVVRNNDREDN